MSDQELIDLLARDLKNADPKAVADFQAKLVLAVEALEMVLETVERATTPHVGLAALGEVFARRMAETLPPDRDKYVQFWWRIVQARIDAKVRIRQEAALKALLEESQRATKH